VNKIFLYSIISVALVIFSSCGNQKKLAQKTNQALLYQPSANIVRPEYLVYHTSDTISQILIKINLSDLLFNQANPENKMMAKVRINYQLTNLTTNPSNTAVSDSSTWVRSFDKTEGKQFVVLSTSIKATSGNIYRMKVVIYDFIREVANTTFITINKKNKYTAQNIKLCDSETNAPIFKNYLIATDSFKIQLNNPVKKLYIKYQAEKLVLPPPPFSSMLEPVYSFHADSVWVTTYNTKKSYHLPYTGLYLIQTDTLAPDGLYMANFGPSFPLVNEAKALVPPIEYLTTTEEFKNLSASEKIKFAVDSFWLVRSGNSEISRELIRIYYSRMQYANTYFTSFKPGWKTDRGMIYMIFGPPSYIKKTELSETWEYYIKQDATNLTIDFIKTDSPYSDNHYIMKRYDSYTSFWREAVHSWRSGYAYSMED
jgi:GWxTD domain-containing protein